MSSNWKEHLNLCQEYTGKLNIRYFKINHTLHPIWKEMNSENNTEFKNWYHTPALSYNIGFKQAQSEYVLITQPEIILHPLALYSAVWCLDRYDYFLFGNPYMSNQKFVNTLRQKSEDWKEDYWDELVHYDGAKAEIFPVNSFYWFIGAVRRDHIMAINGVDEQYLRGVYGEDDDFRIRIQMNKGLPKFIKQIEGIHQNHIGQENGHRDRHSAHWVTGAERNRSYFSKIHSRPLQANIIDTEKNEVDYIWGDSKYIDYSEGILL